MDPLSQAKRLEVVAGFRPGDGFETISRGLSDHGVGAVSPECLKCFRISSRVTTRSERAESFRPETISAQLLNGARHAIGRWRSDLIRCRLQEAREVRLRSCTLSGYA